MARSSQYAKQDEGKERGYCGQDGGVAEDTEEVIDRFVRVR